MLKHLKNVDDKLAKFEMLLCLGLLGTIAVTTVIGVFARYILRSPIIWGVDVTILSLIWLSFLGAGILFRQDGHLAASSLPSMLPKRAGAALKLLSELIIAGTIAITGWFAVTAAIVQNRQFIITLGLPRSVYSMPIVWMSLSMMLVIIIRTATTLGNQSDNRKSL
ncbi:hypothetical protein A9Q96_16955 [Rhodobacterales bacterium 52_120_T64]|nr:hypothetical protein A9Q96_16955 [Rhodobacterales bacterium 52_120_T64]